MTKEETKIRLEYVQDLITKGSSAWDQEKTKLILESSLEHFMGLRENPRIMVLAGFTEMCLRFLQRGGRITFHTEGESQ